MIFEEELKEFDGNIIINGKPYTKDNLPDLDAFENLDIYLEPSGKEAKKQEDLKTKRFIFTVKEEMTEFGKGQQNFHKKWNNDNPMPYRRMIGNILEELDSMYKISAERYGQKWEGYILKDFIDSMEEINE